MSSDKILILSVVVFFLSVILVKSHKKEGFQSEDSAYVDSILGKYLDESNKSYADMMKSTYLTADCYAPKADGSGWVISDGCRAGAVSSLLESQVGNAAFRKFLNDQQNAQILSVPEQQKGSYQMPQK